MPPKKQKRALDPEHKAKLKRAHIAKKPNATLWELNDVGLSAWTRRPLCECELGLIAIESHSPGRITARSSTIQDAFLTISVPKQKFADLVAGQGYSLASSVAIRHHENKDLDQILKQQEIEKQQALEEQQRLEAERQKREKEAAEALEALRLRNAGFITLYYDNSEQKKDFRRRRQLGLTTPSFQHVPGRRVTRGTNLAVNTSFGANGNAISPASPVKNHFGFPTGVVPPLTPADTDSRRQSLFEGRPTMSSVPDTTGGVQSAIKDVIDGLFVLQQHVSGYRAENEDRLVLQVEDVAEKLSTLEEVVTKPDNPLHDVKVAPDIIDYVDDGRNPDIFTRDFVELVQRGNSVMNGKQKAFKDFSKIFATTLKQEFEGMDAEVDMIMGEADKEERNGKWMDKELQNGRA